MQGKSHPIHRSHLINRRGWQRPEQFGLATSQFSCRPSALTPASNASALNISDGVWIPSAKELMEGKGNECPSNVAALNETFQKKSAKLKTQIN